MTEKYSQDHKLALNQQDAQINYFLMTLICNSDGELKSATPSARKRTHKYPILVRIKKRLDEIRSKTTALDSSHSYDSVDISMSYVSSMASPSN